MVCGGVWWCVVVCGWWVRCDGIDEDERICGEKVNNSKYPLSTSCCYLYWLSGLRRNSGMLCCGCQEFNTRKLVRANKRQLAQRRPPGTRFFGFKMKNMIPGMGRCHKSRVCTVCSCQKSHLAGARAGYGLKPSPAS